MAGLQDVQEIADEYLIQPDIARVWTYGPGIVRPGPLLAVGVDGMVNVLQGDAPLQGTPATLRAWMLARAEALIAALGMGGWWPESGYGPVIEFSSHMGTGLFLLNGKMVLQGAEDSIGCRVKVSVIHADLADKELRNEVARSARQDRSER